ncbi:MAG TPA: hypothetical protein GX526_00665, partial [Thermoanaerobacterales bacterium]|nr:hypothetical protein [Thermoanaerobacterales bacterium]
SVSAQGYGDEVTFDFRAGKTGYRVVKPYYGIEFLKILSELSTPNNPIQNMKIFSHSYPRGLIMSDWSGFYDMPGPYDNNKAAYLHNLKEFTVNGKILFAPNSEIIMFGCNLANNGFTREFSVITGGTVIASHSGVMPEIAGNRETGIFISPTYWVKYTHGNMTILGKRIRAW